jgi:hypothetical protein
MPVYGNIAPGNIFKNQLLLNISHSYCTTFIQGAAKRHPLFGEGAV